MLLRSPRPKLPLRYYACPELVLPLHVAEQRHIERAMVLCLGNTRLAATQLEISYRTLLNKLRIYRAED